MPHIQDPTIARKLFQELRLTGLPDSILAPEVVPVIIASDISNPIFSDIERGCTGMASQAGVALENSHIVLRRLNQGTEVIVKKITFDGGGAAIRIFIGRITSTYPGGVVSTESSFDDFGFPGRPSAAIETGTVLPGGLPAIQIMYQTVVLANTAKQLDVNIRLGNSGTDSDLLWTHISAINAVLNVGFEWTERPPFG